VSEFDSGESKRDFYDTRSALPRIIRALNRSTAARDLIGEDENYDDSDGERIFS